MFLKKKGFTLVEIMIVVALLGLVAVTMGNLTIDSGSTEKLGAFTNRIAGEISNAKTSALLGKGNVTGNTVNIPTYWEADLKATGSNGSFSIQTNLASLTETLKIEKNFKINALYCLQSTYRKSFNPKNSDLLAEKKAGNKINESQIRFEKTKTTITTNPVIAGCKGLIIETAYITPNGDVLESKTMTFNRLSGVVER